jgi:hypothetical protein
MGSPSLFRKEEPGAGAGARWRGKAPASMGHDPEPWTSHSGGVPRACNEWNAINTRAELINSLSKTSQSFVFLSRKEACARARARIPIHQPNTTTSTVAN